MKTSNFAKHGNNINAVSISGCSPDAYKGREYKKLAPSWSIYKEYRKTGDVQRYIKRFKEEILAPLDATKVFKELGSDAILLCYEKEGEFCHRHLVAQWFEKELNIKVEEIRNIKIDNS
ncbi:MAG: DUF488 domain-containing protein [Alphaproteobacteria bacterium]|jgi:hypothetical protein|nr:DUF488 domain-containing protein [Alphaproteobacteria bacterium]